MIVYCHCLRFIKANFSRGLQCAIRNYVESHIAEEKNLFSNRLCRVLINISQYQNALFNQGLFLAGKNTQASRSENKASRNVTLLNEVFEIRLSNNGVNG